MPKLKSSVRLGEGYPELTAEIFAIPSRDRPSRLVLLAHTGLMAIQSKSKPTLYSSEFKTNNVDVVTPNLENVQCILLIGRGYIELYNELYSTPSRDRPSRIRFLAHVGLSVIHSIVGKEANEVL